MVKGLSKNLEKWQSFMAKELADRNTGSHSIIHKDGHVQFSSIKNQIYLPINVNITPPILVIENFSESQLVNFYKQYRNKYAKARLSGKNGIILIIESDVNSVNLPTNKTKMKNIKIFRDSVSGFCTVCDVM